MELISRWPKIDGYDDPGREFAASRSDGGTGERALVLGGELAEPLGDGVDGRLAGGDIDHEVVDVVVAGA